LISQHTSNVLAILFSKYNNQKPVPERDGIARNCTVNIECLISIMNTGSEKAVNEDVMVVLNR
jgi:hypothetical protein